MPGKQDHLQDAKYCIDRATRASSREAAQAQATLALANAVVALVELLRDTIGEDGEKSLYIKITGD